MSYHRLKHKATGADRAKNIKTRPQSNPYLSIVGKEFERMYKS